VAADVACFARAWAAASAAAPAGVSAADGAVSVVSPAFGGSISPGPTSVRFGAMSSMGGGITALPHDSKPINSTTRDKCDYRA
jgi:hypothetical protein